MKEEQDDLARSTRQPLPGFDGNSFDKPKDENPEYFSDFDTDGEEGFEEPDRDTDYALGFREETVDEEQAFENFMPEELEEDTTALFEEQEAFLNREIEATPLSEPAGQDEDWPEPITPSEEDLNWPGEDQEAFLNSKIEAASLPEQADQDEGWEAPNSPSEEEVSWTEEEQEEVSWEPTATAIRSLADKWGDDDYTDEDVEGEPWPLSLLIVGVLALLLVVAGVYGMLQQRGDTQEQIRELQASLATTADPEELIASRSALQNEKALNARLNAQISSLKRENARLADTVGGLEKQLQSLQQAAVQTVKKAPAPKPAAVKAPATKTPAASAPTATPAATAAGAWFVNFGSYGNKAVAEDWSRRLQPVAGKVIVASSVNSGRTFYRVRVVNLPDKATAEQVSEKLQATYGLPKLWVGKQ